MNTRLQKSTRILAVLFLALTLNGCSTQEQLLQKAHDATPEFGFSRRVTSSEVFIFEFGGRLVRYMPNKGSQIYGTVKKERRVYLLPKDRIKIDFTEVTKDNHNAFASTTIRSQLRDLPESCVLVACSIAKQYAIQNQYALHAKIVSFFTHKNGGHGFALLQHKSGAWYAFDAQYSFPIPHSGENSPAEASRMSDIFIKKVRPDFKDIKYAFIVQES